jgi:glutamate dehydrogenase/leucine dehydrogenase
VVVLDERETRRRLSLADGKDPLLIMSKSGQVKLLQITADEFGPKYVVEVNSFQPRFKGLLVIDNLARGVGKGGIRMAADLTMSELFRLARTMTWKNAIFELPFGGAKASILIDPKAITLVEKKKIIQEFARLLSPFVPKYYIAGPDIGTGEREMAWFSQALGDWQASTGKPINFCVTTKGKKHCGLPHELGSTGFGVAIAAKTAANLIGLNLNGASIAIAGFGNVGSFAARFLSQAGAKIVAVADREGTVFRGQGLPIERLCNLKKQRQFLTACGLVKILPLNKIYELPVDILIPAAISDVITEKNYRQVRAKIIVEGANIPIPERIEEALWKKGIVIVPDFVANGGGVISSFAEYQGYQPKQMLKLVEKKIKNATAMVLSRALKTKRNPREIALVIAKANL